MNAPFIVGCLLGFFGGFVAGVTAGPLIRQALSGALHRIPRPEVRMIREPQPHPNWYARWAPTIMLTSIVLICVSLFAAIFGILNDRQQDRERVQSTIDLLNCFSEWGDDVVGATGAVRGASADKDEALRTALATLQDTLVAAVRQDLDAEGLEVLIADLDTYQRLNRKLARTRVDNPVPAPLRERCASLIEDTEPSASDERVANEPLPEADVPTREPRPEVTDEPAPTATPTSAPTVRPTAAPTQQPQPTQQPTRPPKPQPTATTVQPQPSLPPVPAPVPSGPLDPVLDLVDGVLDGLLGD